MRKGNKIVLKDPRISFLISRDGTTIEVHDSTSSIQFLEITLTNDQLASALSRMGHTKCEATLMGIELVGKRHENKDFVFEIPEILYRSQEKERINYLALESLKTQNMEEWTPDGNYNSQNSFFSEKGKHFARTTIRRYVDEN